MNKVIQMRDIDFVESECNREMGRIVNKVIQVRDIDFVESECNREMGRIVIVTATTKAYDAIMELLNDGVIIE